MKNITSRVVSFVEEKIQLWRATSAWLPSNGTAITVFSQEQHKVCRPIWSIWH